MSSMGTEVSSRGINNKSFVAIEPPSSTFKKIADKLSSSDIVKQQAIEEINAGYAFIITGDETFGFADDGGGQWYVGAKEHVQAGKGRAPGGEKPDVIFELDTTSLQQIVQNPSEAQKLISAGKIKVSGDQTLVNKLDKVLALGKQ